MTLHPVTSLDTETPVPSGEATFAGRMALSVAETAQALGVSRALIHQECRSGRLHSVTVGTRRLIPVASINAWLGLTHGDD